MPTDLPAWANLTVSRKQKLKDQSITLPKSRPSGDRHALPVLGKTAPDRKPTPRIISNPMPLEAAQTQSSAVRNAAATASHNTFRPEIFRVTEGYLN